VSSDIHEDDLGPRPDGSRADRGRFETESSAVERRLEGLAEEMGRAIEAAPQADREALHDYAVSLVRDRLPTAQIETGAAGGVAEDARRDARRGAVSNAATLIGYGILLLPIGVVLLVVFPPVGMLLIMAGVASVVIGLGVALVTKVLPRASSS